MVAVWPEQPQQPAPERSKETSSPARSSYPPPSPTGAFAHSATFFVSTPGRNGSWQTSISTGPTLPITFLVSYKNNTSIQQDNVVINVDLPDELSYVKDSSILGYARYPDGVTVSDHIADIGINVGSYSAGANAWVIFSARFKSSDVFPCIPRTLSPLATVTDDSGSNSAEVTLTITKRNC